MGISSKNPSQRQSAFECEPFFDRGQLIKSTLVPFTLNSTFALFPRWRFHISAVEVLATIIQALARRIGAPMGSGMGFRPNAPRFAKRHDYSSIRLELRTRRTALSPAMCPEARNKEAIDKASRPCFVNKIV